MKCMVALARYPEVVREMLTKRVLRPGRAPHSAGNMLLMGIEKVYGDYYEAVKVFGELLDIAGTVIPVSTEPSTLYGSLRDGSIVEGQVAVAGALAQSIEIERVFLTPQVKACKAALTAISKAEVIVIGPGSLYESVLPNFLPTGIVAAIKKSKAPVIYIENLLTEGRAMPRSHGPDYWVKQAEKVVGRRFSRIIINSARPVPETIQAYEREGKHPLLAGKKIIDRRFIAAPLWKDKSIARHDPEALSATLTEVALKLCR